MLHDGRILKTYINLFVFILLNKLEILITI